MMFLLDTNIVTYFPDAMVCATAMSERAVLLTNDKKLHEIYGLQCRALELRV
jgi:predicted nucleic acid-binding protein